jgi:hypothetical protein
MHYLTVSLVPLSVVKYSSHLKTCIFFIYDEIFLAYFPYLKKVGL